MSDEDIKEISERLNNTPRKCLGWKTPAEVFREKNIGGNVMSALPYPKTNKSRGSRIVSKILKILIHGLISG